MDAKLTALLGSLFIFGILENLFPFFQYKQSFSRRVTHNFVLGIVNAIASSLTIVLLLKWVWQQNIWLGLFAGIKQTWLVAILAFLILDLYLYFWHRLMHTLPVAWRFHRVHHTEMEMNISTAYRFHTMEVLVSNLPKVFLIWLFGIEPIHAAIYELLFTIVVVFHHSNWNLPYKVDKFLSYLIVTPNYHRIHHSQIVKETNSNYASLLSVWDRFFKSYRYSKNPESIKIGLVEYPRELNFVKLLKLPF
ncbi:sterol desaturase family protein [Aerosakkonema sp. BLCC-F183]|uniref:sterol desaturase family protein n=1 Tax=Aerosakkonema sp. BLCC-F183 TaxID=3342834 RepID=UPI0035B8F24F